MERLLNGSLTTNAGDTEAASDRALWRLCGIFRADLEGLRSMIEEYVKESLRLIKKMQLAARMGDLPILRRAAHTLKANALVFGELTLSRVCATLEGSAAGTSKDSIDSLIHKCTANRSAVA